MVATDPVNFSRDHGATSTNDALFARITTVTRRQQTWISLLERRNMRRSPIHFSSQKLSYRDKKWRPLFTSLSTRRSSTILESRHLIFIMLPGIHLTYPGTMKVYRTNRVGQRLAERLVTRIHHKSRHHMVTTASAAGDETFLSKQEKTLLASTSPQAGAHHWLAIFPFQFHAINNHTRTLSWTT